MYAAIAGAAISAASGIAGGIKAREEQRKLERMAEQQQKRAQARLDRDEYMDWTQTAANQRLLTRAREQQAEYIKAAEGRQAVMGGTDESVAAEKQRANQAYADAVAQVAANAEAQKERAVTRDLGRVDNANGTMMNMQGQNVVGAQQATSQGFNAGMGLISADAQSYLDSGKGLMQNIFKKRG